MKKGYRSTTAGLLAGLALFAAQAAAQNAGVIKLVVGASPGGATDLVARAVAKGMSQNLGQTVLVENKAGAAGNIAGEYVASSKADGNTLLVNYTSFSANTSLYKKMPFDPVKDFTPVSKLATVPSVLAVRKDFPASNMQEFLALIRANPGKYTAGLGGLGSSLHIATELLKAQARVDIVTIPYKGAAPAMVDLLGGHIDFMFDAAMNVVSHVQQGTIKVLGVTSTAPLKEFPGAAPIADVVPGFESSSWYGVFAPAGVPAETVDRLSKSVRAAVATPEFRQLMESQAASADSSTPEELAVFLRQDIEKHAEIVRLTGISMD